MLLVVRDVSTGARPGDNTAGSAPKTVTAQGWGQAELHLRPLYCLFWV